MMNFDGKSYRLLQAGNFGKACLGVGILGLVASAIGYAQNHEQLMFSYLISFGFWITLALGGLFFTLLHHLTAAKWSVVLRKFTESIMSPLPIFLLLLIPVLLGAHSLYHWSHADAVAKDALLQHKAPYLNIGFFAVRALIYFAIWTAVVYYFLNGSDRQDAGEASAVDERLRKISAPAMVLFAFTLTYSAIDWYMSIDAHWYSTIFGVYIFAGCVLSVLAFVILLAIILRQFGILKNEITVEHYHDLGKLLFAFTVFWGYIAFSQYMLIWYANIPEETIWFAHRWEGSWKIVSMLIVIGHFCVPFFGLITRSAKRTPHYLALISIWVLFMHWVDLYWIIMPNHHHHGVHLSWMDFSAMAGVGGLFLFLFWRRFASRPLVPVGDPNLETSIHFVNH